MLRYFERLLPKILVGVVQIFGVPPIPLLLFFAFTVEIRLISSCVSEEHKGNWGAHKVPSLAVQGFPVGYTFVLRQHFTSRYFQVNQHIFSTQQQVSSTQTSRFLAVTSRFLAPNQHITSTGQQKASTFTNFRQSLFKRFSDGGKFGVSALAEMESLTVGNRLSARLGSLKADLSSTSRQPSAERTFTK